MRTGIDVVPGSGASPVRDGLRGRLSQPPQSAVSQVTPFPPMGGANFHGLAALRIGPTFLGPPAREDQSVRAIIVDDSQLKVLIVRSAFD